jgi:hypothetical protein
VGKITVKRATQMSGHSLKLHFCMFEKLQGKHNTLDCHFFLEYFPIIAKFTCSKLDTNEKKLACSKHSNFKNEQSFFFQTSFLSTKCAPFLLKIEKDFNIDDLFFNNPFEHIWFKSAFDLENYGF